MKTLKSIVEGILGDLDADLENATTAYELQSHPIFADKLPGWGTADTEYNIKGDTLDIVYNSLIWTCNDNKFFDIIKGAGIKHIKCNSQMLFRDIDFNIDKISIETTAPLNIKNCKATIKNCQFACSNWRASDNKLSMNNVSIKCIDDLPSGEASFMANHLEFKKLSLESRILTLRHDKHDNPLKGSDWSNYVESLGIIKILPSGRAKVLAKDVELDKDFVPLWGTADIYNIFLDNSYCSITFMEEKLFNTIGNLPKGPKAKVRFKNGWVGVYLTGR